MQELDYNNQEIERQEIKLDKLNQDIDVLQSEERGIQEQLKNQAIDMDKIKRDRDICQQSLCQIGNVNLQMQDEIREEKQLIERFEQ